MFSAFSLTFPNNARLLFERKVFSLGTSVSVLHVRLVPAEKLDPLSFATKDKPEPRMQIKARAEALLTCAFCTFCFLQFLWAMSMNPAQI